MNYVKKRIKKAGFVGISSVVNVLLVGLVRFKLAAVLLGPTGIGAIGILTSFVTMAAQIFSFGVGPAASKRIATNRNRIEQSSYSAAVLVLSIATGMTGGLITYVHSDLISNIVIGNSSYDNYIAYCSVAIFFGIVGAIQTNILIGRDASEKYSMSVICASVIACAISVISLYLFINNSLVIFVISLPIAGCLFAIFFNHDWNRSALNEIRNLSLKKFTKYSRITLAYGLPVMVAGLMNPAGQFTLKILIGEKIDINSVGVYQAASNISGAYLGFILSAMGAEYYPRIAGMLRDRQLVSETINNQIAVAVIISSPAIILTFSLSNYIVSALYSSKFDGSSSLLQMLVLGDIIKILSWPIGVYLLASGKSREVLISEFCAQIVMLSVALMLIPHFNTNAIGYAYIGMYVTFLILLMYYGRIGCGFYLSMQNLKKAINITAACISILVINVFSDFVSIMLGGVFFVYYSCVSLVYLKNKLRFPQLL